MKRFLAAAALFLAAVFISLLIAEAALRVYDPFHLRIRRGRIVLPVKQVYAVKNSHIRGLDAAIKHSKNSLGFRGAEPPVDLKGYLSIIVIGGSTTECFYLSDDKTWPYLLGEELEKTFWPVWLNNAGLDGHSTFGHILLLEDYVIRLRPKVAIFLVGANDVARGDLSSFDRKNIRHSYASWKDCLEKNSEVFSLFAVMARIAMAKENKLAHGSLLLEGGGRLSISEEEILKIQASHAGYVTGYKMRMLKLIELARRNNIDPVLITQPLLCGKGKDPVTEIDLEAVRVSDSENGKLCWGILELYNNATREIAAKEGVFLIDLAHELPKNSLFFYDNYHFSNAGAEAVAKILSNKLTVYLSGKYKAFLKKEVPGV